jgi:hypothetical protein
MPLTDANVAACNCQFGRGQGSGYWYYRVENTDRLNGMNKSIGLGTIVGDCQGVCHGVSRHGLGTLLWVEPYSIPLCQTKERKKETKEGKRETKRKSLRPKFNKKQKALRDRSTHRCTHCCLTVQQQNKKVSRKTTPEEPKHST